MTEVEQKKKLLEMRSSQKAERPGQAIGYVIHMDIEIPQKGQSWSEEEDFEQSDAEF